VIDHSFIYGGQGAPATESSQNVVVAKVQTSDEKAASIKKTAEDVEKARIKELNANMLAINRFLCSLFVFTMFLMNLVLWVYLGS
jgi:hypothetical protein